MTFDGVYPMERWDDVRDLVIAIGKKHGFSHITMLVEKPGDYVKFVGHDQYGATYEFGMAKNTTFGIRTGCHSWNATPTPPPYTPLTAF